jgi:hypothetical protein
MKDSTRTGAPQTSASLRARHSATAVVAQYIQDLSVARPAAERTTHPPPS